MKKNTLLLFFLFYILNTSLTVGQNSPRTVYNINIDNAKNLGDKGKEKLFPICFQIVYM